MGDDQRGAGVRMAAALSTAPPDAGPTPEFQTQTLHGSSQSWAAAVGCDGQDRHELTMPMAQAAVTGTTGAGLIILQLFLHVDGPALGTGIALVSVALLAWFFAQWVNGPVLYYRRWGEVHRLSLSSVTAVAARSSRGGARSLLLSAPGLAKPLRISLEGRGYVMTTPAREHLRGWLSAPDVQWTPEAAAVFDDESPTAIRKGGRSFQRALAVALPLLGVAFGAWVATQKNQILAIPGAPDY
jgi:hypothetical protein